MRLEGPGTGRAPGGGATAYSDGQPLDDLQQSYLVGRGPHLPLGGVAMQEFRAYSGRIDLDALERRLRAMVVRHDALRTVVDPERRVARVAPAARADLRGNYEAIDLGGLPRGAALARIEGSREDYAHALSDLARPPWNVTAFRLPAPEPDDDDQDTAVVFARFDALILDGRGIAALMVELFGGAEVAEARADAATRPPADAERQRADAAYWAGKLAAVDGSPRLPWRRPLASVGASRYARESLTIEPARFRTLCRLAAGAGLFKHAAVAAVVLEAMAAWVPEGSLCVGMPVALPATGPLANRSSFIAVDWDPRRGDFRTRAQALQGDVLTGLDHLAGAGVPLSRLLMQARPGGGPALPVVVTNGLSWPADAGPDARLYAGLTQTPQVAVDVRLRGEGGALVIDVDHAGEAIDAQTVRDILAGIDRLTAAICARDAFEAAPGDANGDALDPAPDPRAPDPDPAAPGPEPSPGFLQRISDNLFAGDPGRTALIQGGRRVAYGELGAMVDRAARALRARGVRRGDVVAICLGRSPEHAALTLACALSGAVWVPVDAASPPDRLAYLLANCRPALVVRAAGADGCPEGGHACATPEDLLRGETAAAPGLAGAALPDPDALSASEAPAYYLYTSGTTGRPKCVVLANRATGHVVARTLEAWGVTARDVFLQVTPLHHDMSVFDVLGCLAAGATLVLPEPGEERDAVAWNQLVAAHGVTLWCSVPAILEMLLAAHAHGDAGGRGLRSLRLVAQGGDYIKPATLAALRRLDPPPRLVSLGGPTETTIWSIWHAIEAGDVDAIPYGRPLPGNRYFVLNERGGRCPPGVVGRMHVAGVNVALGYLRDGALDQTDFVAVDDGAGGRLRAFRTGDLGTCGRDGTILFAGRVDGYVKVRGVRVSLPDVETELGAHPGVRQIVVVTVGAEREGEAEIGAVYVPTQGADPGPAGLRAHARRSLPDSHVPTRFLAVAEVPLSANGKPDRRRARALLGEAVAPPLARDARAERILDLYLGVLGRSPAPGLDAGADFLRLGLLPSHLKAVSGRIRDAFGLAPTPHQLLRCRNAAEVARLLADLPPDPPAMAPVTARVG